MDIFVTGLPEGLLYDMKKNIISGILKDTINKTYTVNFKAVNSLGSAERKFDIVVGDEIALTPPMG